MCVRAHARARACACVSVPVSVRVLTRPTPTTLAATGHKSDDALNDLKIYVMRYVYGDVRSSSLDLLRAEKWRCQKKKSLMRLPPDDDCLKQHNHSRVPTSWHTYSVILSLEIIHLPSAMARRG